MNDSLITVRYAKALFQLAEEENKQEAVRNDIELLLESVNSSNEFADFLENPLIKSSEKNTIINSLFKENINDLTFRFLQLLINNKREGYLKNICQYTIHLHKQKLGIQDAVITTAQEISSSYKKEIFDFITRKFKVNIELQDKIDPAIIGGFILRIEDQQINASIQSQLMKIKRELINS
jgi:F-type H+-transporting ATPase subunit delta